MVYMFLCRDFFNIFFPKMDPWFLRMAVCFDRTIIVLYKTFYVYLLDYLLICFAGHVLLHVVSTVIFNSFISRRFF